MNTIPTDLIRINQATEILNLKAGTIYNLVSKWVLPFIKQGNKLYFSLQELHDWKNTRK